MFTQGRHVKSILAFDTSIQFYDGPLAITSIISKLGAVWLGRPNDTMAEIKKETGRTEEITIAKL